MRPDIPIQFKRTNTQLTHCITLNSTFYLEHPSNNKQFAITRIPDLRNHVIFSRDIMEQNPVSRKIEI